MWRITVKGVVQGVGFRPSVVRTAVKLGSKGFVRNDGSHVTIGIDTDPEVFMGELKEEIGPIARIEEFDIQGTDGSPPPAFSIKRSSSGERDSSLPYDTALCEKCLREMRDPANRRYRYPFTNCTDCGARYTVIEKLPYDRERTTMEPFEPCRECSDEYSDIGFRRYHAQTLSCPADGPRYRFLDRDLREMGSGWSAFLHCAEELSGGRMIIVKGWGGMHIISDPDRLEELREWYGRPFKPFAVMVDGIRTAMSISKIGGYEEGLLTSPARPIVLVKKKAQVPEWAEKGTGLASPGLDNIGLYLPYSGIHHLLFDALKEVGSGLRWFVMTSANPPGEPMALTLESASKLHADGYLVHDRKIAARCDDSVVVPTPRDHRVVQSEGPFGIRASPIRKSRGMVPDPLPVGHGRTLVAVGPERNVSITVTSGGKAFTSPYVGNTRHPSVLGHASDTVDRLSYLFGADKPEAVVCDLHPRYATRRLALEISEERGIPLLDVQHHHAHAASLHTDAGLEGIGAVIIDGVGYGTDGLPWGGEALICRGAEWERIGHLEQFGLPGGDSSVHHPERIAHWLSTSVGMDLTTGDPSADRILRRSHDKAIMTTSLGRLLDAMSSLMLGVTWRSYDGEPAMRMEALLSRSREPDVEIFRSGPVSGTVPIIDRWKILLEEIDGELRPGVRMAEDRKADLSMGLVSAVLEDLVHTIADHERTPKDSKGRSLIGLSGGVSFSFPIMERFVRECIDIGAVPVLHSRVPAGDGGVSQGQAVVGGYML